MKSLSLVIISSFLTADQIQALNDRVQKDLADIDQIQSDEAAIKSQYNSTMADKDGQIAVLNHEVQEAESFLAPPSNVTSAMSGVNWNDISSL